MAHPQTKNGYLKIANDIMDALTKTRIPGESRQIIDTVIRKTYGFNKKDDDISLSQFCLATGLKKPTCCRAIKKAVQMNLIIKKDNGNISSYRFNKDFDTWRPLSKKITVIKKDNKSLSKKIPTKNIYTKDNIYSLSFQNFWTVYPKKKDKQNSIKAWIKLRPDSSLAKQIISFVEKAKKSTEWENGNGQYIPYPSTFINGRRWEDELTYKEDWRE